MRKMQFLYAEISLSDGVLFPPAYSFWEKWKSVCWKLAFLWFVCHEIVKSPGNCIVSAYRNWENLNSVCQLYYSCLFVEIFQRTKSTIFIFLYVALCFYIAALLISIYLLRCWKIKGEIFWQKSAFAIFVGKSTVVLFCCDVSDWRMLRLKSHKVKFWL